MLPGAAEVYRGGRASGVGSLARGVGAAAAARSLERDPDERPEDRSEDGVVAAVDDSEDAAEGDAEDELDSAAVETVLELLVSEDASEASAWLDELDAGTGAGSSASVDDMPSHPRWRLSAAMTAITTMAASIPKAPMSAPRPGARRGSPPALTNGSSAVTGSWGSFPEPRPAPCVCAMFLPCLGLRLVNLTRT